MPDIPPGFEIVRQTSAKDFEIIYRSRRMGAAVFFSIAIPAGLMIGGLLFAVFNPDEAGELFSPWQGKLCILAFAIAARPFVDWGLFQLYGRIRLIGNPDGLMVERKLLGFRSNARIPAASMKRLEQIKDGGEGESGEEDSFLSRALTLVAKDATSFWRGNRLK